MKLINTFLNSGEGQLVHAPAASVCECPAILVRISSVHQRFEYQYNSNIVSVVK